MADYQEPRNLDAERAVLGCLLLDNQRRDEIAHYLKPEHFWLPAHGLLYVVINRLIDERRPVDALTLVQALRASGEIAQLDTIGGAAGIAGLTDGLPRSSNLDAYARIVRELAARCKLIRACEQVIRIAATANNPTEELADDAEAALASLRQGDGPGWLMAREWMTQTMRHVEALNARRELVTGVSTGLAELDAMTRGFQPGDLVVLGARPSMGKTSLAMQMALTAAQAGMTAVFSVEMGHRSLGLRALALEARIDGLRMMTGRFHQPDYGRMTHAVEVLSALKLAIDDSPRQSVPQIRAKARRLHAASPLAAVFVDYLQILANAGRAENRTLEVAQMSSGLKQLARELDVPVIVLSQLSRDTEKREVKRPRLSDLRDSGAIEQDADLVLLLHRPEYYQQPPDPEDVGRAELLIAKQRNGSTGMVTLRFHHEHTRFGPWDGPEVGAN